MQNKFKNKIFKVNMKGIILGIMIIVFLNSLYESSEDDLSQIVLYALGGLEFENHTRFLITLIPFLLPQIIMLAIWGDYFNENIVKNYNIIFTRTRNIKKIIFKYIAELSLGLSVTVVIFEAIICFIYGIRGYVLVDAENLFMGLLLYLVYMNFIIILENIASLFIKSIYSSLAILVLQIIAFDAIYFIKIKETLSKIYYFIPSSVTLLYENISLDMSIKGLWVLYLIGIIIVVAILGITILRKKEFIN